MFMKNKHAPQAVSAVPSTGDPEKSKRIRRISGNLLFRKESLLSTLAIYLTLACIIVISGCGVLRVIFKASTDRQAQQYVQESLSEIGHNLTMYQNDLYQNGRQIAEQTDIIAFAQGPADTRVRLRESVRSLMSFYLNFEDGVRRLYLCTRDNSTMSSPPADTESDVSSSYLAFLEIRKLYDFAHPFREPVLTETIYTPAGEGYYALIVPIYPDVAAPRPSQYLGALVLICDTGYLSGLIPQSASYEALITEKENVIVSTNDALKDQYTKQGMLPHMLSADAGPWRLILFHIHDGLAAQEQRIQAFVLVITGLIIAVNILLMYLLYRRLVGPLSSLVEQVDEIGAGPVRIQPLRKSVLELGYLTDGMNDMLERIDTLNTRLRESEVRHYQEHVMFLQTQINPHFLYNNLECIRGMTQEDQEDIRQMVSAIARIYRYCNRAEHMAPLREEMDCASIYARILELRYGKRFSMQVECLNEEALSLAVPRMILQPLMENSVRHGFEACMRKEGNILVQAFTEESRLFIRIRDNGGGMDTAMLERVNGKVPGLEEHKHHIGIANVRRRLELLFDGDASLVFTSDPTGTLAVIQLPQLPTNEQIHPKFG